ncbi:MAG: hypothetical protein KDE04_02365 [Anaerolineales bacterium]|nr:hypothetical protein [Anaerolineales bacterium]MCB8960780.1 hypothetical protein [Ardenticatenales bacterium]
MIRRIITLIPLALMLIGCSLGIRQGTAEIAVAEPINLPSPTVSPISVMQTTDASLLSTRVAVSGLEGTSVAVEATTQSMNQQATLNAVAAVYAADAATATSVAYQPTATAEAVATQNQAILYAEATAAATRAEATAAAATIMAGELAVRETSVAVQSTSAAITSLATREALQVLTLAEEEQLRRQQQQIALERSELLNRMLRGAAVAAPVLLGLYIALSFYRERRRLLPVAEPAGVLASPAGESLTMPARESLQPAALNGAKPTPASVRGNHLAAPEWASLGHWRGTGLPLGVSDFGLMSASMESQAHLLFLGSSGSNITRAGLRPVIAAALGNGWHVSIFDRSGWDYLPFDGHDNAAIFILGSARELVAYLATVHQEVQERLAQGQDKRSRRPRGLEGAKSLIVVDQFGKLAGLLDREERAELWRHARLIAADGHKVGIHLALALQDPTPESFDLRIRRHCLPLAFRLQDEAASRLVLGSSGAESLPERHFLAPMPELIHGIGFAPSDIELQRYLAETRGERVDGPIWTRAARTDVLSQSKQATVMSFGALPVSGNGGGAASPAH